jgi:Bacterial Ig-like domain
MRTARRLIPTTPSIRPREPRCPVESLEQRLALATFTPTTFSDLTFTSVNSATGVISGGTGNGQVTLRSAVIASNANGVGADTINLNAGTYTLSISSLGTFENAAATGDLDVNGSLAVQGTGSASTIITTTYDASCGDGKVFGVNQTGTFSGLTVSFSALRIQNGFNNGANFQGTFFETGGGVDFFLTGTGNNYSMTNCVVANNRVQGSPQSHGAGVNVDSAHQATPAGASAGSVTFTGCTFSGNTSSTFGGGVSLAADKHNVTMTNCTVTGNVATAQDGGGIWIRHSFGGTVDISGGSVTNNSGAQGGGISIIGNQLVNITGITVDNNTATGAGAGAPLGGGIVISNLGAAGVAGGTTIANSVITNNHADGEPLAAGGGLYFNANYGATVTNTQVSGNTSESGAGVYHGGSAATPAATLTMTGGYIINNVANANGGGVGVVDSANAVATFNNLTLSGNTARLSGGGVSSAGATATFANVTIANNRADADNNGTGTGGGISRTSRNVVLRNTLVGTNLRGSAATADDVNGTIDPSSAFNLIGVATASGLTNGVNSNQVGSSASPINPRLGPLATNGGATLTHMLLGGSPALDAGSNALVPAGITTDQRGNGFARLKDAGDTDVLDETDIGAYEAHPAIQDIADQTINEDAVLSLTFHFGDVDLLISSVVFSSSNASLLPNAQILVSGSGASRTLQMSPPANAFGTTMITVTITGTENGFTSASVDTFVLTVNSVNDAPSFVKGPNQSANAATGAVSIPNWATLISAGPTNESSQTLTFLLTTPNAALFSMQPSVSPGGTLTFTAAPDVAGEATVNLRLQDSGGTANGGVNASAIQSFTISIDTQPPAAPSSPDLQAIDDSGVFSDDNITNDPTLSFDVTSAEANATVQLLRNNVVVAIRTGPGVLSDNVSALSSGVYLYTARQIDAAGNSGIVSGALSITRDTVAPQITASTFGFETSQSVAYVFSEDVQSTLAASDIAVQNLTTVASLPDASKLLSYVVATNTATLSFAGFPSMPLADGNYRNTIASGSVTDLAGNALGASTFDYFVLAGDADRNRTVNFNDLLVLAQNYNQTGKTFSQGNFDYSADGLVGFNDLLLLAQRYNQSVLSLSPNHGSALPETRRKNGAIGVLE